MLSAVALPASVNCEDFLSIVWALYTMVELGKEFCESDSALLLQCLAVKSEEHFTHMHKEAFQVLRSMVDSESWLGVNINLEDMGGVLGILKKNIIVTTCNNKSRNQKEKKKHHSILQSFADEGNPFRSYNNVLEDQVEVEVEVRDENNKNATQLNMNMDTIDEEEKEIGITSGERGGEGGRGMSAMCDIKAYRKFLSVEIAPTTPNINLKRSAIAKSKTTSSSTSTPIAIESAAAATRYNVVTQTCLNGLARYTGRYLQLMFLLPYTAPTIFSSLCSLYDFYLCAVYWGFVPSERQTVFGRQPSTAAAAPNTAHEYEVRTCCVCCTYCVVTVITMLEDAQHSSMRQHIAAH